MSTMATARPTMKSEQPTDSPEEIAEMMAEAARVDALFQSGALSTLLFSLAEAKDAQTIWVPEVAARSWEHR
jgi:hypothetical protein